MMRNVLLMILMIHTVITVIALRDAGPFSVFPPFRERFVYQIFSDLVAANGIIFLLCYLQLKKKSRPMLRLWLAIVGTAIVGTFAPIAFLLSEKDLFDA